MKLVKGDKLVCIKPIAKNIDFSLQYGKTYLVINTRSHEEEDICIDFDGPWWFGQIGSSEPWTNWFVLERQWSRENKLKQLGI
jgi:hypothetical protein